MSAEPSGAFAEGDALSRELGRFEMARQVSSLRDPFVLRSRFIAMANASVAGSAAQPFADCSVYSEGP
jgi:hypothetical protein